MNFQVNRLKSILFENKDILDNEMYEYWNLPTMQRYYQEYYGADYVDNSLGVTAGKELAAVVISFSENRDIKFFNQPSKLLISPKYCDYESSIVKALARVLKNNIIQNCAKIRIFQNSFLSKSLFDYEKERKVILLGRTCLNLESELLKGMRKSYRSLINWGKRELVLDFIDCKNADYKKFCEFKEVHFRSAGRMTRSDESWDLQFELIKEGNAFLVLGQYHGQYATGVFITMDQNKAFYAVGASDRKLMSEKNPLSHWPIASAMLHAGRLGKSFFEFGEISKKGATPKEDEINRFKRGFCHEIVPNIECVYE